MVRGYSICYNKQTLDDIIHPFWTMYHFIYNNHLFIFNLKQSSSKNDLSGIVQDILESFCTRL